MIARADFDNLKQAQKEEIVTALFNAKYPGFEAETGIVIDVPAGYSLRAAAILICEEEDEIVKKIFVLMEEFNKAITAKDITTLEKYISELAKTEKFEPERDDIWFVTNKKWTYEAYKLARGKLALMDIDTLLKGIEKYYSKKTKKARELRDKLRHYSLVK